MIRQPDQRSIPPARLGLRTTAILGLLTLSIQFLAAQEPTPPETSSPRVTELLQALTADDFQVRRSAEQELIELAPRHLREIGLATLTASNEATIRLLSILEVTFQKHEDETGDFAERILMALARRTGPTAERAESILMANGRIREGRARKAIEALGGQVIYQSPYKESAQFSIPVSAGPGVGYGEPGVIHSIWLYEEWRGGNEGLWHLGRFSHVPRLVVYTSPQNGLDRFQIQVSAGARFGVSVEVRGGCLGISSLRDGYGNLTVNNVLERTAAEAAGLQPGDIITELNGKPIRSFDDLVSSLETNKAGDLIELVYHRPSRAVFRGVFPGPPRPAIPPQLPPFDGPGQQEFRVQVRLRSWRESQLGADYIPPPTIFRGPFGPPLGEDVPAPPPLPIRRLEDPSAVQMQLL